MSQLTKIESTGLVKYDAMQRAIVAARAVDEVKDIRDKAQALEKYAQQARNFEAERRAAQIRIHAELKGGQLLKVMTKAKGGGEKGTKRNGKGGKVMPSHDAIALPKTLDDLGISPTQSSRWQALAENPKAVEKYLKEEGDVPTTAGALAAVAPAPKAKPREAPPPFSDDALWVDGRLRDLAAREIDPPKLIKGYDAQLRETSRKYLDALIPTLKALRSLL